MPSHVRYAPKATDNRFRATRCNEPIVLQNSFLKYVQNFPDALVRSPENYVGGHMINQNSNRQPS